MSKATERKPRKSRATGESGKCAVKRTSGRPSPYAGREMELAVAVAERMQEGETLKQICRSAGMPSREAIDAWRRKYPEIEAVIAIARARGFDAIAEDCLEIADETKRDTIDTDNGPIANTEWISRSKLRVWTRLQLLAKWDPKRYGDKLAVDQHHSGGTNNTLTISDERIKEMQAKKQRAIAARLAARN